MELALSIALAVATIAAATGWTRRQEEKTRVQRLADEVTALRKAASGQRVMETQSGSTPSLLRFSSAPEGEDLTEVRQERLDEVRRVLGQAEEALMAAEARPRTGSALPVEELRHEAVNLLSDLERLEISFSVVPERGATLIPERALPIIETPTAETVTFDASLVEGGLRGTEDLSDTAGGLKDDLAGLARSTDRLREATGASAEALAAVARGAEAIAPMAGALSAVANRVNLLALNLAVLVSPGAAGANVEEAGTELRSIFEEARRLSREVNSLAQRVASAARGASERGTELASAIAEERARVERGMLAIGGLDDLAAHLRKAFDSIRQAGRASDEECRRLHAELAISTSHAESLAASVLADRVALTSFSADLRETARSLTQLRLDAERTVRNLLAIAETAAERRAPAPDSGALDSVREALKLLS